MPIRDERYTSAGLLEALSWRPRKVTLIPDSGGICSVTGRQSPILIKRMKFTAGASCDFQWTDPNVSYRISKEKIPLRPQEGRELWRDTGPLALLSEKEYESEEKVRYDRPGIIRQYTMLDQEDDEVSFTVYGMRTNKMKIFEWRKEKLTLPYPLVLNSAFHNDAQAEMDRTDKAAKAIQDALNKVYKNLTLRKRIQINAQQEFWSALENSYNKFLYSLAPMHPKEEHEVEIEEIRGQWLNDLRNKALTAFNNAIKDLDSDADQLRMQMEVMSAFEMRLTNIIDKGEKKEDRNGEHR